MNTSLKPSQIVLMASGAVTFLFSFFAFFKYEAFGEDMTWNAWSGEAGTLFLATWPAIFGVIIAGLVAAVAFGNVSLPDKVLTFSWPQIFFVLSLFSLIIMVGYLLGGGVGDGGPDKGFGFIFMLLGSIGMTAGAVMELLGVGPQDAVGGGGGAAGGSSGQPPSPF